MAQVRARLMPLGRQVRAELAVVLDEAFTVAPDDATARAQCQCLPSDPQALHAAKAVWPRSAACTDGKVRTGAA
ncbi:hypothetical protein, partial [Kushneria phosphatilytica]|uniref:hypothetical protein n=1 Tax=Kushneria phosphatilytica TaxID=657387 RepID=UPI00197DB9BB